MVVNQDATNMYKIITVVLKFVQLQITGKPKIKISS